MGRTSLPRFMLLAFLSLSAAVSMGQSSQSYLNDTGATAYGVTIPVENGYIDISNGNLHLEFPLAASPQRGALSLSEKLVYDSRIWLFSPFGTKGSYHWWPTNVYGAPANSAGWRLVTGGETGAVSTVYLSSSTQQCQWAVYGGAITTTIYSIVWTDPRGMAHPFTARSTQVNSTCPYQQVPPSTTISSGQATDGSGYTISGGDANGNPIVLDSSGTQVYPSITDRFGNFYSADSAGNLIDTTGRVPVIATSNGSTTTYDVLAPNGTINNQGTRVRYTVTTTSISVNTDFVPWQSSDIHQWSGTLTPVQSIALPDGSKYTFGYDADGELNSVSLPTGGSVSYGYANFFDSSNTENRLLTSRTMGSNSSTTITPSVVTSCANYSNGCVEHVTVHKPSGDEMVYELTLNNGAWNTGTTVYTGSAASGRKLLQTTNVNTYTNPCSGTPGCYGANYLSKSLSTTVAFTDPSQSQSQAVHAQTQSSFNAIDGKINNVKEWDYLPSSSSFSTSTAPTTTPARETRYAYTSHDLQQVTVLDSKGKQAGQTTYAYTSSATATSGLPQHGSANDVGPYLNTVTHWLNTGEGDTVTTYAMYDTGQVKSVTDAKSNPATTFTYQCAGSLPLTATNPLTQSTQYGYDCSSGALTSVQDANDLAAQPQRAGTTYSYEATAGRVQKITQADGGTTTYSYPSSTEIDTAVAATPNPTITSSSVADVYGRPSQQVVGTSVTDTTYDTNGRPFCTSVPHLSGATTAASTCISSYDGLDRPLTQKQSDGNSSLTWTYSANVTASTNEAGNTWTRTADAFGRITSVVEPGGAQTGYTFDGLGNANSINQQGVGPEIARNRSFTYDSMSRLITSQTPEAGTICYGTWKNNICSGGYDPDNNLKTKTDARGTVITYSYDALNRLMGKAYSDGTASISYDYDKYSAWNGIPRSNLLGRLAHVSVGPGTSRPDEQIYSYDSVGRLIQVLDATPSEVGITFHTVSAAYDLAGSLTDLYYPDGRHINQASDAAGRLKSVGDGSQTQTYVQSVTYNPDGSPNVLTLGNGVQETITENNRLQVQGISVSSPLPPMNNQSFLSRTYCRSTADCSGAGSASNTGNIWQITDNLNSTRTQSFSYDSLNRIRSFSLGGQSKQQYSIDSFGNMSVVSNGSSATFDPATNRITNLPCGSATAAYDAAGNQLCDSDPYGGVRRYTYNAESQISAISSLNSSTPFVTYTQGADGSRVRKTNADGTWTEYVYFDGQVIAEKDQTGSWTDYVYGNGQKIAKVDSTAGALHLSGNTVAGSGSVSTGVDLAGSWTVQAGDTLYLKQYTSSENGIAGGIWFGFTNGDYSTSGAHGWIADQNGQSANWDGGTKDQWNTRIISLQPFVGLTVNRVILLNERIGSTGQFDLYFADVAVRRADGSVIPLWTDQSHYGLHATVFGPGSATSTAVTFGPPPGTSALATGIHYVLGDHLGSARMELSTGGWPVWTGDFTPVGQELNATPTSNNYKYTGLEHDNESGLDHAMARQYSFITGRWMSPDPYDGSYDLGNPQSLNRYVYALNNPLTYTDPSGLDHCEGGASTTRTGAASELDSASGCRDAGGSWIVDPPPNDPNGDPCVSAPSSQCIVTVSTNDPSSPGYGGPTGSTGSSSSYAPSKGPRSGYESLFCLGDALQSNGLSLALDAVGLLPEGGVVAGAFSLWHGAAGVSNGIKIVQRVKVGAGIIGTASSGNDGNTYGTVVGAASIGATLAKAVPIVGQVLALGALGGDLYSTRKAQNACVASGKYD